MQKFLTWFCSLFSVIRGRKVLLVSDYGTHEIASVRYTKSGKGYVKIDLPGFRLPVAIFLDNSDQKEGELRSPKVNNTVGAYTRWFNI